MRERRDRGAVLGGAIAAVMLALVGCGPGEMPPSVRHPLSGGPAPEFEAASTGDRSVSVPGSQRTRVTVLDFWASWCAACTQSIPSLDGLWRDRKGDGVMVIGVSVDETEGAATSRARQLGATFPIVVDPYQRIAGAYGVAKVPLTFVIDRAGTVRWVGRDPEGARQAVDVLLSRGGASQRDAFE